MKASILTFSLLVVTFSFTQILQDEYLYETNDHQEAFKKEGVKKMTAHTVEYSEEGEKEYISEIFFINMDGLIEKYEDPSWAEDFQETWVEHYYYDEELRLTKVVLEIQGNSSIPEIEETHYAYKTDGTLDSVCEFHVEGKKFVLDSCEYFFYDEQGRLAYTGSRDGEKYEELEYLENGLIKKRKPGSSAVSIFKDGKGIERIYSSSGNKWEYTFNKKGFLVKSQNVSNDSKAEFEYDKKGLPSVYRSYNNGKLKWVETYTYEYYDKK